MKDFEKTIAFVRDFNSFRDIIPQLWNGNYRDSQGADFLINEMMKYKDSTRLKGEELANEVKEVCSDISALQTYYDMWCNILAQIPTSFLTFEDILDDVQWACRLDDDDKGCKVAGFIRKMAENYKDVMDGKRWLENTYNLTPHDEADGEEVANKPENAPQKASVPQNILRLFDGELRNYQTFINACRGQCPKEIARLYKEHGRIQLEQEKGVVTLIYNHLKDNGLLSCSARNFQRHYSVL